MTVETLDYEAADIKLIVESQDERTKRIRSVEKEPETVKWIESLPDNAVLWDIGANTGSYSLIAASRGLRTVAVEPSAANFSRLIENLALNPHLKVLPLPFLLSHRTGTIPFSYSSLSPGAALHNSNGGVFTQLMVSWALDDLVHHPEIVLPVPTFLKIDVDGSEVNVLRGAVKTLERVQGLLVEVDDASRFGHLIEPLLTVWGFAVVSRHRHGQSPVSNLIFERDA